MLEISPIFVPPSFIRLLGTLLLGNLGGALGLWSIFGPGKIFATVFPVIAGLTVLMFIIALVRQRPSLVITSDGFTFRKLFGAKSFRWEEIDGPFAVIKIGFSKAVGYKLTQEYRERVGKKPTSQFSGYDDAIGGALKLSSGALALLLNQQRQLHHPQVN